MRDDIRNRLNGKDGKYSKLLTIMVGSAGSVLLNTQYYGIDDAPIPYVMHSTEGIELETACGKQIQLQSNRFRRV